MNSLHDEDSGLQVAARIVGAVLLAVLLGGAVAGFAAYLGS